MKSSTQPQPLLGHRKSSGFNTFTFVCLPSSMFLLKERLWWIQDVRAADTKTSWSKEVILSGCISFVKCISLDHHLSSFLQFCTWKENSEWLILKQLADKCFGLINREKQAWQIQTKLMIFYSNFVISVWYFLSNQYSGIRYKACSPVYSYGYYSPFLAFCHSCLKS